jgi:hypothetical protein
MLEASNMSAITLYRPGQQHAPLLSLDVQPDF